MSTHRVMDRICVAAVVLSLLLTLLFMNGGALGLVAAGRTIGYEDRLFDTSRVHTIDIVMDDWEGFLETCQSEEYSTCSLVIDGESYKNVGIRGKGNTSLSSVAQMDSSRYSFKVEFDQYDSTKSYHGLDKFSLNNLIQDNTMMKDYLTYQMMNAFGAAGPLCSFAYLTVNGEDWGLYLAVEAVEDAFLQRNYGSDHGQLYKPDSMSFGGGRGNGQGFEMGGVSSFGSASDVKLQYIDDDPDSYANIFDSAKTDVSDADQARLISSLKSLSDFESLDEVLDTDAVLRYFVVHNFVVNGDSYTGNMIHNYYLYEEDGRLSMIPWDYNLAFGTFQGQDAAGAVNDAIDDVLSDRPMQAWIFSDERYTQRYHALYAEFLSTVDPAQIIDSAYALIADYVAQDPTKFCTVEEFEAGVQALRSFCALRQESVRGQLDGTVPSTSESQSAQRDALVSADGLDLSDMGTMNNGGAPGGPGGFDGGGNGQMPPQDQPDGAPDRDGDSPAFAPQPSEGEFPFRDQDSSTDTDPGEGQDHSADTAPGSGQDHSAEDTPPDGGFTPPGGQTAPADGSSTVLLLAVSVLLLLAGLLIAYKFK